MNQKLWLLCVAAVLGVSACGQKDSAPATPAGQSQSSQPPAGSNSDNNESEATEDNAQPASSNFLADAAALQKAEDELKALPQFGGKELSVFQDVRFYGGKRPRITVEVQDPNNPDNIDHYEYENGKWSEPQPVQISGGGDMKDNVTPLAQVKFATVAEIAKAWSEKAKEVGAAETELDYAFFSLFVPTQKRSWRTSTIETDRAKYSLDFKLDGTVESFEKQ